MPTFFFKLEAEKVDEVYLSSSMKVEQADDLCSTHPIPRMVFVENLDEHDKGRPDIGALPTAGIEVFWGHIQDGAAGSFGSFTSLKWVSGLARFAFAKALEAP